MNPTDAKTFRRLSFAVSGFNVDREAGLLRSPVLLSGNREAKGHGLYIDADTIRTGYECAAARQQLKGAIRHLSWDEYFAKGADRVLDFPGWFSGFAVKGDNLTAATFEFYETFRTDPDSAKAYARIMEIADKTPNLIGLSIECWGYAVFVGEDGKEYGLKPDGVALKYDGVPALRITDLFFAAFVDEPAATDGLFAKFQAKLGTLFGAERLADRVELVAALRAFAAELETEVPLRALNKDASSNPDPAFSATMKIIAELKAKFTDPQRFASAMSIVGNTPADQLASLTVGAVESQLAAVDLTAAQAQVTKLTTDLATANGRADKAETELAALKAKFEKFKTSGNPRDIDLGAGPSSSPGATQANPWLKESLNYTKQAEIEKADPALAAQFKAAAGK